MLLCQTRRLRVDLKVKGTHGVWSLHLFLILVGVCIGLALGVCPFEVMYTSHDWARPGTSVRPRHMRPWTQIAKDTKGTRPPVLLLCMSTDTAETGCIFMSICG